jgi:hypothetical protein
MAAIASGTGRRAVGSGSCRWIGPHRRVWVVSRGVGRRRRTRQFQDLCVVADHRQAAQHHVESGGLGGVVAFVIEVGLVHDRGEFPQHRVGQVVAAQDRLEGAVRAVVPECDAAHVERGRVVGHLGGVGHEYEHRLRVDVAAASAVTAAWALLTAAGADPGPDAAARRATR